MKKTVTLASLLLTLGLTWSLAALAADTPTLRVLVVQTNDVKGYAKELDNLRAIMKKSGTQATLRVWRARFAGADTGAIVVGVEYPSFAALAKADELASNPEWVAAMGRLTALRKITSDSIYEEVR